MLYLINNLDKKLIYRVPFSFNSWRMYSKKKKLCNLFTAQVCISQLKPWSSGHGGESNIYPVFKDDLFPLAPGPRNLLKAPHSGGIWTPEANEETIQIGIVRLRHIAKVKLYLFSFIKNSRFNHFFFPEIVICCENWPSNIHVSYCTSGHCFGHQQKLYGPWYYINAWVCF